MASKNPKKKKGCGGCLALVLLLLVLGGITVVQDVYFMRRHTGFTQLLGNDEVLYTIMGTTRIGDHTNLLAQLISFFQWQPSAVHQRDSVTVYRFSRAGFERAVSHDMSVRGAFFLDGNSLVYLKSKSAHEEWRPVWEWRDRRWQPLPQRRATRVYRAYSRWLNQKALGKQSANVRVDVEHHELWEKPETRIPLQGQLFIFKTKTEPSPTDENVEKRRLTVEGLYGFSETLLVEDQAWTSVPKATYEQWFGDR